MRVFDVIGESDNKIFYLDGIDYEPELRKEGDETLIIIRIPGNITLKERLPTGVNG